MLGVPSVVWVHGVAPYLEARDLCSLRCVCRHFLQVFSAPALWRQRLAEAVAPIPVLPSAIVDSMCASIFSRGFPSSVVQRRLVAAATLQHLASLPASSMESFSLLIHLRTFGHLEPEERDALQMSEQRLRALDTKCVGKVSCDVKDIIFDPITGKLLLPVTFRENPLVVYGHGGIYSSCHLQMVNRRIRGNVQNIMSFATFHSSRQTIGDVTFNVQAHGKPLLLSEESAPTMSSRETTIEAKVSTAGRRDFRLLGLVQYGDEEHFFALAAARSASMSHAEAKHFDSKDVDYRLQTSMVGMPNIAAGSCVQMMLNIDAVILLMYVLQIRDAVDVN